MQGSLVVFERFEGFTIQALGVAVNDFEVFSVPCLSFQLW
jgi:hypothetical protein